MKIKLFFIIILIIIFPAFLIHSNSFENNYQFNNPTNITISFSFKIEKNAFTFTPYSILKDIKYYYYNSNYDSEIKTAVVLFITLVFLVPIGGCLIIAGIPLLAIGGYNDYYNMEDNYTIPFYASGGACLGLGHALLIPTMICGIIVGSNL